MTVPGNEQKVSLESVLETDEILSPLPSVEESEREDEEGVSADLSHEEITDLMDEVYSGGRRLKQIGDSVLMVSQDGMRAFFRGRLPEGTGFLDALRLLEENGIRFGIIQNRLHEVLPHRRVRRKYGRSREKPEGDKGEVVVAEGQPPVPAGPPRVEYYFEKVPEEEARKVRSILEGYDSEAVKSCDVSLPLVQPGQKLAEVIQEEGRCGRDVFGEEIPPAPSAEASLEAGENVELEEGGRWCRAAAYGYACFVDGRIEVIPPIWVSRDLMRVFFVFLPQKKEFPTPRDEEIKALLERSGIVHGLSEERIARLCRRLGKGQEVERLTLIACGTEAITGRGARWRFEYPPDLTRYFGEIVRLLRRSPHMRALSDDGDGLSAKVVTAGEQIAFKEPPVPGTMGKDVFGEEFMPDDPEEAILETGEGIRLSEDGTACFAEIYGYLGIGKQGKSVQIASPIWVAPNRMTACFVNLPQLGHKKFPTPEQIDRLLERAGVKYGIDQRRIGILCEKMRQGLPVDIVVPLAGGRPPRRGEDGRFEFSVDRNPRPGFFQEDGSIDFRKLNLTPMVNEGMLIGIRIPAVKGAPGIDVTGREIQSQDGQEVAVDPGRNVRRIQRKGREEYRSEIDGELVVVERKDGTTPVVHLEVHPTMHVQGNVDYHTGSIDYPGSVHVAGSIQPGFEVKAEGNVIVGDSVEEGAAIRAGGNVAVKHGIVGEGTRVSAAGSVFAKYINGAEVRARADVNVAEYLFHASVRADGEVRVWGTTRARLSGLIAGGSVIAGERIRARGVGTEASESTQLVAGIDPAMLKKAARLRERIGQYNATIGKLLRALQVERMNPKQIRQILLDLVLRAKGSRRKILACSVKNLLELQKRLESARNEKIELEKRMEEKAMQAGIEVSGEVSENTVIKIGACAKKIGEETSRITDIRFSLGKDNTGKIRLQMKAG